MTFSVREALARVVDLFGPQASWDPTKLYGNLMVSPAGNVLIGTLTDDTIHKLQVNGTTLLGGNGLVFPDGSLQYSGAPQRNRIINGLPLVTQRAASVAASSAYTYGGPDRFVCAAQQGGFTQSTGSMVAGGVTLPAVTQTVTTAVSSFTGANSWSGIQQIIEGYNAFDMVGQPIAFSFLFYTNVSGTFTLGLADNGAVHSCVQTFTASAGVLTVVQAVFPASSSLVIPNSSAQGLYAIIGALGGPTGTTSTLNAWQSGNYWMANTATNWAATNGNFIAATRIKVEPGPLCTPWDRQIYSDMLAECQRFYQIYVGTLMCFTTATGNFGGGFTPMRGVPLRLVNGGATSCTNTNSGGGWSGAVTGAISNYQDLLVWFGAAGPTVGQYCVFQFVANAEY